MALQGAAEYVLANCTKYMNEAGEVVELTGQVREELQAVITAMADRGLRTLCLAFRDMPDAPPASKLDEQPAEDLTACCIVGIKVCALKAFDYPGGTIILAVFQGFN